MPAKLLWGPSTRNYQKLRERMGFSIGGRGHACERKVKINVPGNLRGGREHTHKDESNTYLMIRLDSRLDTAHYGLGKTGVTADRDKIEFRLFIVTVGRNSSFPWPDHCCEADATQGSCTQVRGRDHFALYIEHPLERTNQLQLSQPYIYDWSFIEGHFRCSYTHPMFLSSACLANFTVLLGSDVWCRGPSYAPLNLPLTGSSSTSLVSSRQVRFVQHMQKSSM